MTAQEKSSNTLREYFGKMKGTTKSPPSVSLSEIVWSWIGAFLGIAIVAYINFNILSGTDFLMMIGSFGASAVLIYGAVRSPLAQFPRRPCLLRCQRRYMLPVA